MKNKYARRSRISEVKVRELVHYFAADLTALQAASLGVLNRNTVNRFYRDLRERILLACEAQRPLFGVAEVDNSFFGARRVKGRCGGDREISRTWAQSDASGFFPYCACIDRARPARRACTK